MIIFSELEGIAGKKFVAYYMALSRHPLEKLSKTTKGSVMAVDNQVENFNGHQPNAIQKRNHLNQIARDISVGKETGCETDSPQGSEFFL